MSDGQTGPASQHETAAPASVPERTAGQLLRELRESAGADPYLLASALKVSPQKLDALENDRLDLLPDVTFARGLASAVCRAFGVDPAPVLERMPVSAPGLMAPAPSLNEPFRRMGDSPTPVLAGNFSKPLLIAVVGLLLGAGALWLLPTLPIQLSAPAVASASADGAVTESVEPAALLQPPAEMPAGAASAEQVLPETPASAAAAATDVSAELLAINATGETWVSVRDAAGKQLVNRTVTSGETVGVSGTVPLSVTIGRKDAVSVTVRGEHFDVQAQGRGNVARFQIR
ncbi:MAG: helix-turn-helix domain-containing protein [Pseudomonadota bacterium]|nr:helix-turn-helix domain-containing protein [Pseudomonadota bacterium]